MKKFGNYIGVSLIFIGIFFLLHDYFIEKKNKAIENMKLLLLENQPAFKVEDLNEEVIVKEENEEVIVKDETNYIPEIYYYIGFIEIPKINLKKGFLQYMNILIIQI